MITSCVVFCGANSGNSSVYRDTAYRCGAGLAQHGIKLVYGGGKVGLMGDIADGALDAGGEVLGIIPEFLTVPEIAHERVSNLIVTDSMHSRKLAMYEHADAAIALPGGYGTLDELFEFLTWSQLGLHDKPIGILNTNNFFDGLILQIDTMVREGFLKQHNRDLLVVADSFEEVLHKLRTYHKKPVDSFLTKLSLT